MVQDCRVEFLLGGEMPEDHCLGNSCRQSDLPGSCAAEALPGKQTDSHPKDLKSPIFRGHSHSAYDFIGSCERRFSDCCLFIQQDVFHRPHCKVSTYLPLDRFVCQGQTPVVAGVANLTSAPSLRCIVPDPAGPELVPFGFFVGYGIAAALTEDHYDKVHYSSSAAHSLSANPYVSQRDFSQRAAGESVSVAPTKTNGKDGKDDGPGMLERFKDTSAYERLSNEAGALGDRLVEELSTTAQTVVLPALLKKIKTWIGVDLSDKSPSW